MPARLQRLRERTHGYTVTPVQYTYFAYVALGALTLIVLTGAAVRLTGSGLGCPTWPKCYGNLYPPLRTHALIEFSNRVVSVPVVLAAGFAWLAALRRRPYRRDLMWLGALLPLGVIAQAVLGGLTVKGKLDYGWVMGHFALSMLILVAAAIEAPDTPALTAAATAAAPASARPVLCVTMLTATTWSTRTGKLDGAARPEEARGSKRFSGTATPSGGMRMAAPLVAPEAPASSGGVPARTAATARLVEGPSRSSEPRAAMSRSQLTRASASSRGFTVPFRMTSSLPSSTACSVSSVIAPAGRPAAIGCPGGAGSKPRRRPPQRARISSRESNWVGMPSASPIASPYRAPRARERASRAGVAVSRIAPNNQG